MCLASSIRSAVLVLALVVALVVGTTPAHAQPGLAPVAPVSSPVPKTLGMRGKRPSSAIVLSATATMFTTAMLFSMSEATLVGMVGALFAPSVGHWYAGASNGRGILLRSAAMTLTTIGALRAFGTQGRDCLGAPSDEVCRQWEEEWEREDRNTAILIFGGLSVLAASSIYDIATAGRSARQWNREHGFTVTPTLVPAAGGHTPGLVLGGRF